MVLFNLIAQVYIEHSVAECEVSHAVDGKVPQTER